MSALLESRASRDQVLCSHYEPFPFDDGSVHSNNLNPGERVAGRFGILSTVLHEGAQGYRRELPGDSLQATGSQRGARSYGGAYRQSLQTEDHLDLELEMGRSIRNPNIPDLCHGSSWLIRTIWIVEVALTSTGNEHTGKLDGGLK